MTGFVMQEHQLAGAECQHRVGLAGAVDKLDFVDFRRKVCHDRAHLSTDEPSIGYVLNKGNHRMHFKLGHKTP